MHILDAVQAAHRRQTADLHVNAFRVPNSDTGEKKEEQGREKWGRGEDPSEKGRICRVRKIASRAARGFALAIRRPFIGAPTVDAENSNVNVGQDRMYEANLQSRQLA